MAQKKSIVWFEEVGKEDVGLVGGKGANLGEMVNAGFPIPYGFIVTSNAYFNFVKKNNLERKISKFLSVINYDNPNELRQISKHIQNLIMECDLPADLAKQIIGYYDKLTIKEDQLYRKSINLKKHVKLNLKKLYAPPRVAVRSSATAEDLPTASFAGQQETYLNVIGESALLHKIKECWASLFTERAIYYRHSQGFDHFKVGLAAVIERMIESEKSGIAFSIDPVTNDKKRIVIEAIFGLGEFIVQGMVTPDHYEIEKNTLIILKKQSNYQNAKLVRSGSTNKKVVLEKKAGRAEKLTDAEIVDIAMLVRDIEKHYYFPQDIEWAIEAGSVYIVQSRPITTIKSVDKKLGVKEQESEMKPFLVGSPASPGIGVGPVVIIRSPNEIDRVKHGDVLVAPQTNPDYVPAMKKAVAIITEKGGRTSHAAIVSRELGIPAVVGTQGVTEKLKNEMVVSVNGGTGEIFKGSLLSTAKLKSQSLKPVEEKRYKTLTKVYVNLAEPEEVEKVAKENVDGVGLLRAEFIIAQIGVHPKVFIKQKKEYVFINHLAKNLLTFASKFNPRPVIYRATDFKTNEYRHLRGGNLYEPAEENPMLGFRGASRYISNPDVFSMELSAIARVWEKGYRNLQLMIPFVRVPWELVRIKEILKKFGILDLPGFKLWIMVEVPSCALNIEEFLKIGIDGVSIGSNDLTMMLLGVDRDNEEVSNIYDERSPIVLSTIEYVVKSCIAKGVTASLCGQAASDFPEVVKVLVRSGATSVSVNPDAVSRTRELIYNIEKEHFKKK